MNVPEDLEFTQTHEWVRMEGDSARVGVTEHDPANSSASTRVDLPRPGLAVKAGDRLASIQFDMVLRDVHAPISGTVVETNLDLRNRPDLVHSDPYGSGWLFRMDVEAGEEIEHLLDPSTYGDFIDRGSSASI